MANNQRQPSFRDVLSGLPEPKPQHHLNRSLAQAVEFTDDAGVRWERRPRAKPLTERRMLALLRDPSVVVVHEYLGEFKLIPAVDREAYWARAMATMAASSHSSFGWTEFRDAERRSLLVVDESC